MQDLHSHHRIEYHTGLLFRPPLRRFVALFSMGKRLTWFSGR